MPGMSAAATAMATALMTTRPMSPIRTDTRGLVLVDGAEPADPLVRAAIRPEADREQHDGPREERDVLERRIEERPCPTGLLPEDVHRVRRRQGERDRLQDARQEQHRKGHA